MSNYVMVPAATVFDMATRAKRAVLEYRKRKAEKILQDELERLNKPRRRWLFGPKRPGTWTRETLIKALKDFDGDPWEWPAEEAYHAAQRVYQGAINMCNELIASSKLASYVHVSGSTADALQSWLEP